MPVTKHVNKSSFYSTGKLVRKEDTKLVIDQPLEVEDEFRGLYEIDGKGNNVIVEPPFNPVQLIALCSRNNILQQCVHVMEVNIDGSGHSVELIDENSKENEKEKQALEDFFKEPYPGISMVGLRRKLRVDLEQTGNAYIEALRNVGGDLLMLRHIPSHTMRFVRLDAPVEVEKTITRGGTDQKVKLMARERRFVQRVGQKKVFFKEFGSARALNRKTGAWIEGKAGNKDEVASEILWFGVDRDATTPYHVPRWINNLPSAIGSRKAEEFNLDFFDAGGMPPALFIIEGGSLTTTVREQLQQHLTGSAKSKSRAAIVEVQSASGTLDQGGKTNVKVERFGDARQSDSMFQKYDERSEEHIRVAFRIPPLFLGKAADYNFASAVTAYMVAEEQVFAPERKEFDDAINATIVKELGIKNYKFVSKPITLKNVEIMLKSLEMAKGSIDGEEVVEKLNDISGMNMVFSKEAEQRGIDAADPMKQAEAAVAMREASMIGADPASGNQGVRRPAADTGKPLKAVKSDERLSSLATQWAVATGVFPGRHSMSKALKQALTEEIRSLSAEDQEVFNKYLATKAFTPARSDPAGLCSLTEGCFDLLYSQE